MRAGSAMHMFYFQLLIVLLLFACDQLTKIWVSFALPDTNLLHINDWINIVSTWNSGVSFGMMKNIPPLVFVFINCVITGYLLYLLFQSQKKSFVVGLPYLLMISGALGNLCDRIVYGAVYDFIDLHIAKYHWPVFNLADVFVTIGGVLFVVGLSVQKEELCA